MTEVRLTAAVVEAGVVADREGVALVCGELLETDRLRLAANGTYYPGTRA